MFLSSLNIRGNIVLGFHFMFEDVISALILAKIKLYYILSQYFAIFFLFIYDFDKKTTE